MQSIPEDRTVRGGVYLCQVGPCTACGACCGLYNITDLSRSRLHSLLVERTTDFAEVPRTVDAILDFENERLKKEGTAYPIANFHHCVFVGLIRDSGERIGCLLHPLALGNNGVDWRGLSFYGGAACKYFFCPTYDALAERWKRTVRAVLDDWYDYGLVIPEYRLVSALFSWIETRTGQKIPELLTPEVSQCLAELLRLKITWPYRKPGLSPAWNFFSTKDTARPQLTLPDHAALLATILTELDTDPALIDPALICVQGHLERAVSLLSG